MNRTYCIWKTGEWCLPADVEGFKKLLATKKPYMVVNPEGNYPELLEWLGQIKAENFLKEIQ